MVKNDCACVLECDKNAGSGGSLYERLHPVVTRPKMTPVPRSSFFPQYRCTVEPLYKELSPRYSELFPLPQ